MAGWYADCGCFNNRSMLPYSYKKKIFWIFYKWSHEMRVFETNIVCNEHKKQKKRMK